MIITLPIPDREVSPNASRGQSRWAAMKKGKSVKKHRELARLETIIAKQAIDCDTMPVGYSLAHYINDIAFYFGKEKWSDLTKEQKDSAYKEFFNGKQEEIEASQWIHIQD